MPETVHILLPVHNRRELTRRFVACLKNQTYKNFHLVLIDDGSTDGTAEMVRTEIERLTIIKGKGDWWWGGALQQGYDWLKKQDPAKDDVVLIINDDTEIDADFLEKGLNILARHARTLLLAQCHDRVTGQLLDVGVHMDWRRLRFDQAVSTDAIDCLTTRGLFLRVCDFLETGGFHPRMLPHYLSDYEFTIRAHRNGFKLLTDPSLAIRVDNSTTGLHTFEAGVFRQQLVKYSRRSASNPIAWSAFIMLACPLPWKLAHLAGLWFFSVWSIISSLFKSILNINKMIVFY